MAMLSSSLLGGSLVGQSAGGVGRGVATGARSLSERLLNIRGSASGVCLPGTTACGGPRAVVGRGRGRTNRGSFAAPLKASSDLWTAPFRRYASTSTMMPSGNDIIGVDLGTTNSCLAVMDGSQPKVIENSDGMRTTPSVVAFTEDGKRLVGVKAKRQAITNPTNTFYATKRLIGRRFDEEATKRESDILPYKVVEAPNGDAWVSAYDVDYSPSQISGFVLNNIKQSAERYLNRKVANAVITVPAYFNDSQRQATKNAGRIAGLDVKRIINEPTAAALAYGIDKVNGKTVAVFDLGGGTFDVSILEILDGVYEVKATNGITTLGGEDFDQAVLNFLLSEFQKTEGLDLKKDSRALQRLREAAEAAKMDLSSMDETEVNLPYITADQNGPKHLRVRLTRRKLEDLCDSYLKKIIEPCEKCVRDAGIAKSDLAEVILVGGMTRMPKVQSTVAQIFGKQPSKSVNPDEAVALGAAIQAGVLGGDVKDLLLLDVTPISLGIETLGGVFTRLIARNSTIPTRKAQTFSTAAENQTQVGIRIYQGEREMANRNKMLGQFDLVGIPPAPRGVPQIEVTFDIDANGILNVSAIDKSTNKKQEITVKSSGGLSEAEITEMVEEAKRFHDADQQEKEAAEARNEADALMHSVEQQLKDLEDKISHSDKSNVENLLSELKARVAEKADAASTRAAIKSLQDASFEVSKNAYSSSSTPRDASS